METAETQAVCNFKIPENLYIPTPPLWIESKGFQGPLDLLWHLIRQQNIDILDIPVAVIAAQYLQYIQQMTVLRFEIAPDYLVMAVRLIQIKSQMLLPKKMEDEPLEEDPRALLVQQLIAYEEIQNKAIGLEKLIRWERDVWPIQISSGTDIPAMPLPEVQWVELMKSYQLLQQKQNFKKVHEVNRPLMTLSDKMQWMANILQKGVPYPFQRLFKKNCFRIEMIITFQAMLELVKGKKIEVHQQQWHDEIFLEKL